MSRDILSVVIHCSDTPDGMSKYSARDIDAWHAARGFRRNEEAVAAFNRAFPYIGYHVVIDCAGRAHSGRHEDEVGEHASGHNAHSLAVCLIGTEKFSTDQWSALRAVVNGWQEKYGNLRIIGHRQVNAHKSCPGFDVTGWVAAGMLPMPGHVI